MSAHSELMDVVELKNLDAKQRVLEEWENAGLGKLSYAVISEAMLADTLPWYSVLCSEKTIAVFDIRSVPLESPQYHKAMRFYFAPGFNPDSSWDNGDGESLEQIEELIQKTTTALHYAFQYLVKQADTTERRLVKIFCEHRLRFEIFRNFAVALEKENCGYTTRFYKNWVEIQHVDEGRSL